MNPPLVIVVGQHMGRCGTSMMMRVLDLGGVLCSHANIGNLQLQADMRNIYGFYEGGIPPQEGGTAVKATSALEFSMLIYHYDSYVIRMMRPVECVIKSWDEVKAKRKPERVKEFSFLQEVAKRTATFLPKQKYIEVDYDEFVHNPMPYLLKIKEFIPFPFDENKAINAIDKKLYIDRRLSSGIDSKRL